MQLDASAELGPACSSFGLVGLDAISREEMKAPGCPSIHANFAQTHESGDFSSAWGTC